MKKYSPQRMLTPTILNSIVFAREGSTSEEESIQPSESGASEKLRSLLEQLILFKNNNWLNKLSFLREDYGGNFNSLIEEIPLPHPKTVALAKYRWNMSQEETASTGSFISIGSFQIISDGEEPDSKMTNGENMEQQEGHSQQDKDSTTLTENPYDSQAIRLTKYKILIDPESEEKSLYRRVDDASSNDGEWVIGFGEGRFLFISSWSVLVASNILAFALGVYFRS